MRAYVCVCVQSASVPIGLDVVRVGQNRIVIYNRIFIPTVYTVGIWKGSRYITRIQKPYITYIPYI